MSHNTFICQRIPIWNNAWRNIPLRVYQSTSILAQRPCFVCCYSAFTNTCLSELKALQTMLRMKITVVYFDQQRHACARVRMVENDQKHLKMSKKVSFSSFAREDHVRHTKKNDERKMKKKFVGQRLGVTPKSWLTPTNFFLRFSSWASRVHDGKGTFFIIFQSFQSISTMWTQAQAWVRWLKYTTNNFDIKDSFYLRTLKRVEYVLDLWTHIMWQYK